MPPPPDLPDDPEAARWLVAAIRERAHDLANQGQALAMKVALYELRARMAGLDLDEEPVGKGGAT